ncbi:MAG: N-acetylglucosamine-specific PTS transporter subunit IIBC, partial [Cellulosilyticaceae bacterium]
MMKYLQKLGKSMMLPVACLPVAGILMGIGYWIDPAGWGANSVVAAFLIKAGAALIDNLPILFAVGVGIGMSDDGEGTSALAAMVSWLMMTTLLSPGVVEMLTKAPANPAFDKIQNAFIGIIAGLIGAACYNKFKNTKLPAFLSFFSGKRSVAIVTAFVSIFATLILLFIWPVVYGGLISLGTGITSTGPIGAGIYGFLNRILIPFGLHHALNQVFWFDVAGISDIGKFWGSIPGGIIGQTGMYQAGFFPVMMFGLPAAALAMYHTAKSNKKKVAMGILGAAALCSFFSGVTEPLEFAFMFLAPGLYFVHAVLTGLTVGIVAALPVRAGFQFSAGFVDWFLSFKAPFAMNPMMLILIGLIVAVIYYLVFRFCIRKFNLKTPGREDDDVEDEKGAKLANNDFTAVAAQIIEGLGGKENITSIDNCVTRLRLEVKDQALVNEKLIKATGAQGVIRPGKTSVQIIVGTQVQFVADEMKK